MTQSEGSDGSWPKELLRVVALRKGGLSPAEFRLREGEQGLSMFACVAQPSPAAVIKAVQEVGKRGELAAAVITAAEIRALGLILVQTRGGTAHAEVNAVHYEARLPWRRRLFLRLRGIQLYDDFNERLSYKLAALARVLDREA